MPGPRYSSRQAIQGACQAAASPKSRPETRLCGPVCTSVVCSGTVTPCFFGVPARAQGTPAAWKRGASPRLASHRIPPPGGGQARTIVSSNLLSRPSSVRCPALPCPCLPRRLCVCMCVCVCVCVCVLHLRRRPPPTTACAVWWPSRRLFVSMCVILCMRECSPLSAFPRCPCDNHHTRLTSAACPPVSPASLGTLEPTFSTYPFAQLRSMPLRSVPSATPPALACCRVASGTVLFYVHTSRVRDRLHPPRKTAIRFTPPNSPCVLSRRPWSCELRLTLDSLSFSIGTHIPYSCMPTPVPIVHHACTANTPNRDYSSSQHRRTSATLRYWLFS